MSIASRVRGIYAGAAQSSGVLREDYLPGGKEEEEPEDQGRANTAHRKRNKQKDKSGGESGERAEKQKQSIARLKISIRGAR